MDISQPISTLLGALAALAGVFASSFLQEKRRRQQAVERGKKYQIAIEAEVHAAMAAIKEKIEWMSRDTTEDSGIDGALCVYYDQGQRLFLGENESMTLSFPLWEKHMNEVVEALDTESFRSLSERISLARKFVAKLGNLKLAFESGRGDTENMAKAIFKDMIDICKKCEIQPEITKPKITKTASTALESALPPAPPPPPA